MLRPVTGHPESVWREGGSTRQAARRETARGLGDHPLVRAGNPGSPLPKSMVRVTGLERLAGDKPLARLPDPGALGRAARADRPDQAIALPAWVPAFRAAQ